MINTGKCPKCDGLVRNVKVEDVGVDVGFQATWKGFSFLCHSCNAILGVQINPLALKNDIIDGVVKELKGRI